MRALDEWIFRAKVLSVFFFMSDVLLMSACAASDKCNGIGETGCRLTNRDPGDTHRLSLQCKGTNPKFTYTGGFQQGYAESCTADRKGSRRLANLLCNETFPGKYVCTCDGVYPPAVCVIPESDEHEAMSSTQSGPVNTATGSKSDRGTTPPKEWSAGNTTAIALSLGLLLTAIVGIPCYISWRKRQSGVNEGSARSPGDEAAEHLNATT